jgi:hypothetical protein
LTAEEKTYLNVETKAKGIFFNLRNDNSLINLPEEYLTELASVGKCAKQMETLARCLQNRNGESLSFRKEKNLNHLNKFPFLFYFPNRKSFRQHAQGHTSPQI